MSFLSSSRKKNIPLIMQIPLYFFIATTCIIALWYGFLHYSLFPTYKKKLWEIMLKKEDTINALLKTEENHAKTLATNPITQDCLTLFNQNRNSNDLANKNYASFLEPQQEIMGFKNILLLDINKIVLFSTTKKIPTSTDLNDELYKNSELTRSCDRSTMCLTTDFSEYYFDPLLGDPALFITTPVMKNKKLIGTLVYQYDQQKIYTITNQYIDLGKTGETALARQDDSFIFFVAPTRNDPEITFKKRELSYKSPLSIQASVLGGQGLGEATDYRAVPVIAAWTFIPKVDWGMVVKMDQSEIIEPLSTAKTALLLALCMLIIWIILLEFFYNKPLINRLITLSKTRPFIYAPHTFKHPLFICMVIFLFMTIKTIINYQATNSSVTNKAKQSIVEDIENGAQKIEQILNKIAFTTQSIADDLQSHRLTKDDIIKRIKRDLAENNTIISITVAFAPYAYDKNIRLYAPSLTKTKNGYAETMIDSLYDYSDPKESSLKTGWYQKSLTQSQVWLDAYTNNQDSFPPTYSYTFFDKNKQPIGVVSTAYKLKPIEKIAEYCSLNRIGYSLLLSDNGTFLFHPITSLIESKKTLLQYAQENGNEELARIAQKPLNKVAQFASYKSSDTQEHTWIYFQPITTNQWTLGIIFPQKDIGLSTDVIRHFHFWALTYCILFLICLCTFLYKTNKISLITLVLIVNIILMTGLISLWRIVQTTTTIDTKSSTIITDQASLDKFLDDLQEETNRKKETPPIKIPCGLLLYSLDISRSDNMIISGYMWNKYNIKKHTGITHNMQFPHATNLTLATPLTATTDNWETVTWNIRGSVYQKQNYEKFPFDRQELQITLEHYDIEKNIILTPDLESYKKISHEDTPGLDKSFTLTGFTVEQTFFSYKAINPVTNFGLNDYGKTTDHYQLIYSLITTRSLVNPLLLFFLPLLGILFSIFCILLVARRDSQPFSVLGPYTATFFSLIILQRVLRDQYPTNTTLYIEYAYFFTYFTIILLTIHTVLIYLYPKWNYYQDKVFPLVRLLFWPFQLASWLITTLIVFY